tara:strand:- start:3984 stop:4406 length:423 start_codon:yes stop_codon:yes gene_type:complete
MADEDPLLSGILQQLLSTGVVLGKLVEMMNAQGERSAERHSLVAAKLEQLQIEGQARSERIGAVETSLERIAATEEREEQHRREQSNWAREQFGVFSQMLRQPVAWIIGGGLAAMGYNVEGCHAQLPQQPPTHTVEEGSP